ncbi:host cell division inhibitor Icd-like protein [Providencia sp. PROV273]|uniref:host cell division inhibitor Icd-like protein n=1 Tax=Providencia sp. PROV273 TaxID=2949960 RepID=UPI00300E1F73
MRILNCGDCPSPFGLLSRFTVDKWSPIELALVLIGGHLNTSEPIKSTPPNSITSTERGLTTNDNYTIEVAMKDHITPVTGRNSHTPKNCFNWRFFSCQQFKYFTVTAHTEQEARSMLPDSPCLFSARIPAKAVAHV